MALGLHVVDKASHSVGKVIAQQIKASDAKVKDFQSILPNLWYWLQLVTTPYLAAAEMLDDACVNLMMN